MAALIASSLVRFAGEIESPARSKPVVLALEQNLNLKTASDKRLRSAQPILSCVVHRSKHPELSQDAHHCITQGLLYRREMRWRFAAFGQAFGTPTGSNLAVEERSD